MINVRTARMLAEYKCWADQRLFDSLAALPPGEVNKERVSVFKNIIGTLNHIYVVDCIWQAHLEGRGHGFQTSHDLLHPELADLRLAQKEIGHWYCDWSARQSEASLDRPVEFTFVFRTRHHECRSNADACGQSRQLSPWVGDPDVFRHSGHAANDRHADIPARDRSKFQFAQYTGRGVAMCWAISERNQRSAGSLSLTPLQTIDNSDGTMSKGGSSARNWLLPSISAHAA